MFRLRLIRNFTTSVETTPKKWSVFPEKHKSKISSSPSINFNNKDAATNTAYTKTISSNSTSPASNSSYSDGNKLNLPQKLGIPLSRLYEGNLSSFDELVATSKKIAMKEKNANVRCFTHNIIMQTLLKRSKIDGLKGYLAAQKVIDLYRDMISTDEIPPNTMTYNLVLKALIFRSTKSEEIDISLCLDIFENMKRSKQQALPDKITYTTVINALSMSRNKTSPATGEKCIALLNEMRSSKSPLCMPDIITYNSVFKVLVHVKGGNDITQKCIDIFKELKESSTIVPDEQTYSAILNRLARAAEESDTIAQCLEVIQEMKKNSKHVKLNLHHCNIYLHALVKRAEKGDVLAADKCMEFLAEMVVSEDYKPDKITYNTAINLMVKLVAEGDISSADKALVLFNEMKLSEEAVTKPDVITYSTILKMFSKLALLGDKTAVVRSMGLLEEMKSVGVQPDIFTYSIILQTIVNININTGSGSNDAVSGGGGGGGGGGEGVDLALKLLEEMKKSGKAWLAPTTVVYTKVINALVQGISQGNTEYIPKCISLLEDMHKSSRSAPDVITYSSVINGITKHIEKTNEIGLIDKCFSLMKEMKFKYDIIPNEITYATILQALLKLLEFGNTPQAFDKILELLTSYSQHHHQHHHQSSASSSSSSSSSANPLSEINSSPFLLPILSSLLKLANKADISVVEKCSDIINAFEQLKLPVNQGDLSRSVLTLNIIIKSLGKIPIPLGSTLELHRADRPWKALELFQSMEQSRLFRPDITTYNNIMLGLIQRTKNTNDENSKNECINIFSKLLQNAQPPAATTNTTTSSTTTITSTSTSSSICPSTVKPNALSLNRVVDAYTCLPMKDVSGETVVDACLDLSHQLNSKYGIRPDPIVYELISNYFSYIIGSHEEDKAVRISRSIINHFQMYTTNEKTGSINTSSTSTRTSSSSASSFFSPERMISKFQQTLLKRRGPSENPAFIHTICEKLFNLGYVENLYTPTYVHTNNVIKAKASISFESAYEFVDYLQTSKSNLHNMSTLVDSTCIYELFYVMCIEKHRTEQSKILERIRNVASLMNILKSPLTISQEKILKDYNLLDDVVTAIKFRHNEE